MTIDDSAISEQGMCEGERVTQIAWFYYYGGLTQSEINDRLGLTRLKVSRLLEEGHQSGIIHIQINSRFEGCLEYKTQLCHQLSPQHVRVIPGLADADVGGRLGIGTAYMLMSLLQPQQMLVTDFGEATMNTLQRLSGSISPQQIRLITLSSGIGPYMAGIEQLNVACSVSIIPAPSRAPSADIARTLRSENCAKDVLLATQTVDAVIVGIGTAGQQDNATIIHSGCISQGEQLMIGRERAVGGILGYFFDTKGDVVTNIGVHNELIGLSLSALKTTPARIGVAGGENKAEAIAAVMKSDYIDVLATDQGTAAAILRS